MEVTMENNGQTLVGNVFVSGHRFLLENAVNRDTFFRFSYDALLHEFMEASTVLPNWRSNDIVKLVWEPVHGLIPQLFYYTCVLKTHYLRLVQRRWRLIFKKRRDVLQSKAFFLYLRDRERGGIPPPFLPGLRGMLSGLVSSHTHSYLTTR
jgi:hypothetical protein